MCWHITIASQIHAGRTAHLNTLHWHRCNGDDGSYKSAAHIWAIDLRLSYQFSGNCKNRQRCAKVKNGGVFRWNPITKWRFDSTTPLDAKRGEQDAKAVS